MFCADTEAGRNSEPTPGATGTCPLCSGPVLAKCGQVNTWHWAHRADQDCDPWTEPLTDWHRAYQRVVPAERCEVVFGKHRADVVAATGQILELQHSTISVEDIAKREAHYGPGMVWLFDARRAYETQRLTLRRGNTQDYVSFQWKHPRRSVLSCDRTVLLDLGEGLLLRIKKLYPGPPYRGWGHTLETVDIWAWLRDGTPPTPVPWTGSQNSDLVARILRSVNYLRNGAAPLVAGGESSRIIKAMLFAGSDPSDQMRAALTAAQHHVDLSVLQDNIGLKPRWDTAGRFSVLCWCGRRHAFSLGPKDQAQWKLWSDTQTWPLTVNVCCPDAPDRPQTLSIPAPLPGHWSDTWG